MLLRMVVALLLLSTAHCAPAPSGAQAQTPPAKPSAPVAALFKGQVATFGVVNDDASASKDQIVSFGQVFRRGEVRPTSDLAITLDGRRAPSQMDAKALYPDGSVRHAVIALRAPRLAGRSTLRGRITATGRARAHVLPVAGGPTPRVQVELAFRAGPAAGRTARIDLGSLIGRDGAKAQPPWLEGPLVREQRVVSASVEGLQVVFDVWTPAMGSPRVDVIVRNDLAQNADIATQTYDAALTLDGVGVYNVQALKHYPYADWRKEVSADVGPRPRIVPDIELLMSTGATPRYVRFRPDPGSARDLHTLAMRNGGVLGAGAVTPDMPSTGGRSDLGPLPAWAVFYLLDPTAQNQDTLFACADAAGSIPWHVRDERTGAPLDIARRPDVWLDPRGKAAPGVLNRRFEPRDTPWTPDDAHQPSLTYLPYLLTGSQYYRDELAMQAAYDLLSFNPQYRNRGDGLLLGLQVRGVAWSLRTLANAAFILPTDDPLQASFQSRLKGNLREIARRYVQGHELDAAGELRGYLPGPYAVEGTTPPWQQDYLVMVLGWIDAMGFDDARPVLAWMTNFIAGRFTSGDRGYDPIYGTPYFLYVVDPRSGRTLSTWAGAFEATFDPKTKPVSSLDYADWGGGYAALARGALATLVNTTGSSRARTAYAFVKARTPGMDASYPKEPNFAIEPVTAAAQ